MKWLREEKKKIVAIHPEGHDVHYYYTVHNLARYFDVFEYTQSFATYEDAGKRVNFPMPDSRWNTLIKTWKTVGKIIMRCFPVKNPAPPARNPAEECIITQKTLLSS